MSKKRRPINLIGYDIEKKVNGEWKTVQKVASYTEAIEACLANKSVKMKPRYSR